MMPAPSRLTRYLPHAVVATAAVMILPAVAVWAITPTGNAVLLVASLALAIVVSVAAASAGAAIWKRRPGSQDVVFADLMLWGWLRRQRAERRLAEARTLLGAGAVPAPRGLSADCRIEALKRLSGLLEARDAYTHGHTRRVTRHAERIALALHLPPAEVAKVRTAAALHDIGKLSTPREILNKPGRLTDEEFAVIRRHPVDGADMLAGLGDPDVTAMVRHHHERLDGRGYPDGLAGEAIPLGARIIAVADTFDAMTSSRSYRGACRHKKALDVLAKEAGRQLDAGAVSAFLGYYSGRTSVAWSSLVTTAPQRLFAWLGSGAQGLGTGAVSAAQVLPVVGAAALLAAGSGNASQPGTHTAASHSQGAHARPAPAPRSSTAARAAEKPRASRHAARRRTEPRHRAGWPGQAKVRRSPAGRVRRGSERSQPGHGSQPGSSQGEHTTQVPSSHAAPQRSPSGGASPQGSPSPGPAATPAPTPLPQTVVPGVQVPSVHVPSVEVPQVDVPGVPIPDVSTPEVDTPEVDVPGVDLPGVRLP